MVVRSRTEYCRASSSSDAPTFAAVTRSRIDFPSIIVLLPPPSTRSRQAGGSLRHSCQLVFVYRNPLEVAASLSKRNHISTRRGMPLWLYYNLCCLRELERFPELARVVSFMPCSMIR